MGATHLRERADPACRIGKVEKSIIAKHWVRGVGENGLGECLDLMHEVPENTKPQ
jgi:hypothetical protein